MADNLPATRGESAVAATEAPASVVPVTEAPAPVVSGVQLGPNPLAKPKSLPEIAKRARKEIARKDAQAVAAAGEIPRAELWQALKFLARVARPGNTTPILSDVLFEDHFLLATDLDIGLSVRIPSVRRLPASIPAKLLLNCVKAGKSAGVTIERSEHEKAPFNVVIGDAVIIGHDAKDFPKVPMVDGFKGPAKVGELPSLEPVLPAVNTWDATRINLSGVFLRFCKNVAVALDGHRLHRMKLPGVSIEGDFIVPKDAIELIDDIAAATKIPAVGHFYKDGCVFRSGNFEVGTRYIEGEFPDYDAVIPKESPHHIAVNRASLVEALTASLPFSTERAKGVKLSLVDDELTLSKEHPDLGKFTRTLPCYRDKGLEKGPTSIGFNATYFLDALRFIKDKTVIIRMDDEANPMRFDSADESLTFVIMPMRI